MDVQSSFHLFFIVLIVFLLFVVFVIFAYYLTYSVLQTCIKCTNCMCKDEEADVRQSAQTGRQRAISSVVTAPQASMREIAPLDMFVHSPAVVDDDLPPSYEQVIASKPGKVNN